MRHRPAAELRDLAIDGVGDSDALGELTRRQLAGDDEAKRAAGEVAIAAKQGSPGARRAVRVCNDRAVEELNRSWEAGRMPGVKRDVGHGPETHDEWRRRHDSPAAAATARVRGRAPRTATNARSRGSRRSTARSSGGGSSGDDDGESEPPGGRQLASEGRR